MEQKLSALLLEAAKYRRLSARLQQKRWYKTALTLYKALLVRCRP